MGIVSPAERTSGRRRDERADAAIVDAVLDLISDGATLSGLSLVAIAKTAGVSRNSVYRRWQSKDALYLDVLESINRNLPEPHGRSAREDLTALLATLIERVLDKRASHILRALNAEADAFPELHRRYFEEIVARRRAAMNEAVRRGIASGEIHPDIDPGILSEVLVSPALARMASGSTDDLDPERTSRDIVALVFAGAQPR
jgi:AcrR family transcriptional regulator